MHVISCNKYLDNLDAAISELFCTVAKQAPEKENYCMYPYAQGKA